MNRLEGFLLLKRFVSVRANLRFWLATEAVMEDLATLFGEDPGCWGLAGLLAGIDVELTEHNPKGRGSTAAQMLRDEGVDPKVVGAVGQRLQPGPHEDMLTRALAAAEPAAKMVLGAVRDRSDLEESAASELVRMVDDPSVAPEASRTRVLALERDGLDLERLLASARSSILRISEDIF